MDIDKPTDPDSQIREHAELLALAIEYDLADQLEAVDWACRLVAEQAAPSAELVELAGAIRPHPLDVVRMLRCIPGSADSVRVFRRFLARARDTLRRDPAAFARVTRALENMAIARIVPESFAGACYGFDDARLLAEQGIHGDVRSVRDELQAFLDAESDDV